MRLSELVRRMARYGITRAAGKGSHVKLRDMRAGGKTFPVPAHNGDRSEVGAKYIKAACETFNIDLDDFLERSKPAPAAPPSSSETTVEPETASAADAPPSPPHERPKTDPPPAPD